MPHISGIRDYLYDRLAPKITDKNRLGVWLDQLLTDVYGQVLCANLYIDLKNDFLDEAVAIAIIENMDFPKYNARGAFYSYIEEHQDGILFGHRSGPQSLDEHPYVRVLSLQEMIDRYLRVPMKLPFNYEAELEVMESFFNLPPEQRENLGIVTAIARGTLMNVWITNLDELNSVKPGVASDPSKGSRADKIRDKLGFHDFHEGKLVAIVYPKTFDMAFVYIPTTVDAHSGCLHYLSIKSSNGWGRTCCLNAQNDGCKERVHRPFKGLTSDFELTFLGEITQRANPDLDHLLDQALLRA